MDNINEIVTFLDTYISSQNRKSQRLVQSTWEVDVLARSLEIYSISFSEIVQDIHFTFMYLLEGDSNVVSNTHRLVVNPQQRGQGKFSICYDFVVKVLSGLVKIRTNETFFNMIFIIEDTNGERSQVDQTRGWLTKQGFKKVEEKPIEKWLKRYPLD